MTERQGISFTLTMVVVGVILFITAVSVISLSGGVIQSFFGWGTSAQEESQIEAAAREACFQKVEDINGDYCDYYVDGCDDATVRQDSSHDQTATEAGCNWADNSGESGYSNWEVQVQGRTIDCAEEGYVLDTTVCPAERDQ